MAECHLIIRAILARHAGTGLRHERKFASSARNAHSPMGAPPVRPGATRPHSLENNLVKEPSYAGGQTNSPVFRRGSTHQCAALIAP